MILTKDTITYNEVKYPVVDVELEKEDETPDLMAGDKITFADISLWDAIRGYDGEDINSMSEDNITKEGWRIDEEVFFYGDEPGDYHRGRLSDDEFKTFVKENLE